MPDITGIEAAKLMSAIDPTVPLILFTILEIEGIENAALEVASRCRTCSFRDAFDFSGKRIYPRTDSKELLPSQHALENPAYRIYLIPREPRPN
jgi:hypothetical protein